MFPSQPVQRPTTAPASHTPLRGALESIERGVSPSYVVLPRRLAEAMPLPWQQQMARLIEQFHEANGAVPWPVYRVIPSRYELLTDLDDDQLAEVGCSVEVDDDGGLAYRDRAGNLVANPERQRVLVSCPDPIGRPPQT